MRYMRVVSGAVQGSRTARPYCKAPFNNQVAYRVYIVQTKSDARLWVPAVSHWSAPLHSHHPVDMAGMFSFTTTAAVQAFENVWCGRYVVWNDSLAFSEETKLSASQEEETAWTQERQQQHQSGSGRTASSPEGVLSDKAPSYPFICEVTCRPGGIQYNLMPT